MLLRPLLFLKRLPLPVCESSLHRAEGKRFLVTGILTTTPTISRKHPSPKYHGTQREIELGWTLGGELIDSDPGVLALFAVNFMTTILLNCCFWHWKLSMMCIFQLILDPVGGKAQTYLFESLKQSIQFDSFYTEGSWELYWVWTRVDSRDNSFKLGQEVTVGDPNLLTLLFKCS